MKYFQEEIEYPDGVAYDILPWGELWNYVSSAFLNGFINYVNIRKAFVLNRYRDWSEKLPPVNLVDETRAFRWTLFEGTKEEIHREASKPGRMLHTKLDCLCDDVLVLGQIPSTPDASAFMFFWFDMDCSDCCIGRFLTNDPTEEVVREFENYVRSLEWRPVKELPLCFFRGWLSF